MIGFIGIIKRVAFAANGEIKNKNTGVLKWI